MYATSDPINDEDRTNGTYNYHLLPIYHSTDLVNWTYHSDAFTKRPKWVGNAGLWAPDIQYFNGKWYLYYSVAPGSGGKRTGGGSAIGVATSTHPTGPWVDSGGPVVEAQTGKAVIDSAVVLDDLGAGATGQRYLFYGSFAGGIFARKLSADGLRTTKSSEKRITIADRYEAAYIRKRDGFYYLFVSASGCCDGDLSGYSVYVGRSTNVLGPYVDKLGASFLDSRVGGTPVLAMNGNKWIGPGHNAIVTDHSGQDWFLYHAIHADDPYFADQPGFTKRPPMLDPLDWGADGWPIVRGGFGASSSREEFVHVPAAQPNQLSTYTPVFATDPQPGSQYVLMSDDFEAPREGWSWIAGRLPVGTFGLTTGGRLAFATQPTDLYMDRNDAPVLTEPVPEGDYVVEAAVYLPIPGDFTNRNYNQAGMVVYGDDNNYVKLVHVAINGTRQVEFAKETLGVRRYGGSTVGTPGALTHLRIVKRSGATPGTEVYTAFSASSRNSVTNELNWIRGSTWTHSLGSTARIGIVSMAGTGYTAEFDYFRVYTVAP
jgi:arabinan endo-1,5-alpha-L-arabinosidase